MKTTVVFAFCISNHSKKKKKREAHVSMFISCENAACFCTQMQASTPHYQEISTKDILLSFFIYVVPAVEEPFRLNASYTRELNGNMCLLKTLLLLHNTPSRTDSQFLLTAHMYFWTYKFTSHLY